MNVTGTQLQHTGCESAVCVFVSTCTLVLRGVVWVLQTVRVIQQDDSYSY